jgi:hypothetical protein
MVKLEPGAATLEKEVESLLGLGEVEWSTEGLFDYLGGSAGGAEDSAMRQVAAPTQVVGDGFECGAQTGQFGGSAVQFGAEHGGGAVYEVDTLLKVFGAEGAVGSVGASWAQHVAAGRDPGPGGSSKTIGGGDRDIAVT